MPNYEHFFANRDSFEFMKPYLDDDTCEYLESSDKLSDADYADLQKRIDDACLNYNEDMMIRNHIEESEFYN